MLYDKVLKHYGRKGMKWGVIRKKNASNSKSGGSVGRKGPLLTKLSKGQQLIAAKKAQRAKWKEKHLAAEKKFLKELENTEKKKLSEFERNSAGMGKVKKFFAKQKLERKMVDAWAVGLDKTHKSIKAERKAENKKRFNKEYADQEKTIQKFKRLSQERHAAVNKQNLSFLQSLKAHNKVSNELDNAFWNELADSEIRNARG